MEARRFATGASVVLRSVDRSARVVQTVWPWTVVLDSDELIALYMAVGTVGKQRTGERGGPRDRFLLRWDGGHADRVWRDTNVLLLHRPGDAHSVWRAWDASTWELRWRYLDLVEPWRRRKIGFDSRDLYLDRWAEPDSMEWHWKDEDEVAWAVEHGRLTDTEAAAARVEGERAVGRILRREPPHDRDWDGWRPDPSWPVATLPAGWAEYEPSARS